MQVNLYLYALARHWQLLRCGGREAGKSEPEHVEIIDRPLHCAICKNDTFWPRRAQLHTGLLSFLDLEWVGKTADCMVCANCGYIHWFLEV